MWDMRGQGAVLVFGGTGGIGSAIANCFAAAGSDVAIAYRAHADRAHEVAESITRLGRKASVHAADATDPEQVRQVLAAAVAAHGRVHTVVWAVGPVVEQVFVSAITLPLWQRSMDIEARGFFNVVSATLPHLREHGGSYVHVGSAGDRWFPPRDGLSVIPKAANEALCRAIAKEEGRYDVRANSVLVGVIESGMFLELTRRGVLDQKWVEETQRLLALKRWGRPDEIGDAAVFLATNTYVTGQQINVSGGFGV